MAGSNTSVTLNPGAGGAVMWTRSYSPVAGESSAVLAEIVNIVDGAGNLLDGSARVQGVATPPASGQGGGTVPSAGAGRIMNLRAYANGADGTVTFTGGSTNGLVVTVRNGTGFDWTPSTEQTCTGQVTFTSSLDFFVEWA